MPSYLATFYIHLPLWTISVFLVLFWLWMVITIPGYFWFGFHRPWIGYDWVLFWIGYDWVLLWIGYDWYYFCTDYFSVYDWILFTYSTWQRHSSHAYKPWLACPFYLGLAFRYIGRWYIVSFTSSTHTSTRCGGVMEIQILAPHDDRLWPTSTHTYTVVSSQ